VIYAVVDYNLLPPLWNRASTASEVLEACCPMQYTI
jgi:hypothetical protein